MTKQEKIQEAWGCDWEKVKQHINNDGWFPATKDSTITIDVEVDDFYLNDIVGFTPFIRPKSISGIENNNGWIKIESEDDLPEQIEGLWEVIIKGEQKYIELLKDNKIRLYKDFVRDGITHFKAIKPTKPPIY